MILVFYTSIIFVNIFNSDVVILIYVREKSFYEKIKQNIRKFFICVNKAATQWPELVFLGFYVYVVIFTIKNTLATLYKIGITGNLPHKFFFYPFDK